MKTEDLIRQGKISIAGRKAGPAEETLFCRLLNDPAVDFITPGLDHGSRCRLINHSPAHPVDTCPGDQTIRSYSQSSSHQIYAVTSPQIDGETGAADFHAGNLQKLRLRLRMNANALLRKQSCFQTPFRSPCCRVLSAHGGFFYSFNLIPAKNRSGGDGPPQFLQAVLYCLCDGGIRSSAPIAQIPVDFSSVHIIHGFRPCFSPVIVGRGFIPRGPKGCSGS